MTMEDVRNMENAERLARALARHMDSASVKTLARALHYNEAQLATDIEALFLVIKQIETQKGC